jgi:hypothetical protein
VNYTVYTVYVVYPVHVVPSGSNPVVAGLVEDPGGSAGQNIIRVMVYQLE